MRPEVTISRMTFHLFRVVFFIVVMSPFTLQAADYEARLDWTRKVTLSTFVTGVVKKIDVNTGDKVKKGDFLLGLEDSVLLANVEREKAGVMEHQRLHDEAKRELDRNIELYERTVLSEHELETAHIDYAKAVSMLKTAQAALAEAQLNLENSQLVAPFDGIIIDKQVEVGQAIVSSQQAQKLLVLAEAGKMAANVSLPYKVIKRMKIGQTVPITVNGNRYMGKVAVIGFEPVSTTESRYNVNIVFSINTQLLRAGQKASVKIQ